MQTVIERFGYALLLVLLIAPHTWQLSLPTDPTYTAGVVEFAPSKAKGKTRARENMAQMKNIIESEQTRDLDILVFPEYVLNDLEFRTYVPDPALQIAPCDIPNYAYILNVLSCAARSRQLYVVINLVEKEFCANRTRPSANEPACDPSGLNTYNTNVVLDRQGRVISRYRKTHLYRNEWADTQVMPQPQHATFTTDFGVTFGHFICFDMLFWDPAMVLITQLGVTDIIYPTYWFSELPFLTAVQLQEGWAYANDINLLAADASNPSGQNTGSGIYAGKFGRLTAVIQQLPSTQLLIAKVPKHTQRSGYQLPPVVHPAFVPQLETPRYTQLQMLRDYNVDIFSTQLLEPDFMSVTQTLCHGGKFCCRFQLQRVLVSNSNAHSAYRYRLAAYSGTHTTHQRVDASALSVCAVVACTNDQLYSCGHIFPDNVLVGNKYYFSALTVSAEFAQAPQRLIMPSSVDALIMPLPVDMYDMKQVERNNATNVSMSLSQPKLDLLTFGIWANYYSAEKSRHNLDPPLPQKQTNAAGSIRLRGGAQLCVLLLLLLLLPMKQAL